MQIQNSSFIIPESNESSSNAYTDIRRIPRGVLSASGACPARIEAELSPDTCQLGAGYWIVEREQKRHARMLRLRRDRRRKLLKLSAAILAAFCMIVICAVSYNVLDTHANDSFKYYTSVTVEDGDTLWQIAEDYIDSHYDSRESYIAEVRSINHLADNDIIYAGQILIVPYFSSEYVK